MACLSKMRGILYPEKELFCRDTKGNFSLYLLGYFFRIDTKTEILQERMYLTHIFFCIDLNVVFFGGITIAKTAPPFLVY